MGVKNAITSGFAALLIVGLSNCGGTTVVQNDRTLVHKDGTYRLNNVTNLQPVMLAGDADVHGLSKDDYNAKYGDRKVDIITGVSLDGDQITIASTTVDNYKQFDKARDRLDDRFDDINKFFKSKKCQLDITKWQD
jgi:hypothetical protein